MGINEYVNGISSIKSVLEAYEELRSDAIYPEELKRATNKMINDLYEKNDFIKKYNFIQNENSSYLLGQIEIKMPNSFEEFDVNGLLKEQYNCGKIEIPYKIDINNFAIIMEYEGGESVISDIVQRYLINVVRKKLNLNIRCVDLEAGGSFFSLLYPIISELPEASGGNVISKEIELEKMIKELENDSKNTMAKISGRYNSVFEYNQNETEKLSEYVVILNLGEEIRNKDLFDRIKVLIKNGKLNGISFFVIAREKIIKEFVNYGELHIVCNSQNKITLGTNRTIEFKNDRKEDLNNQIVSELIKKIQKKNVIDTSYLSHDELKGKMYALDSTKKISIPFAIDDNGVVQEFEVGGEAPPHALISGSTGSGKSVALHTLILQTIYNYHPDDVEIWAIDYKAVEFNSYILNRAPHFKVIAQDTSMEFSLSLLDTLYNEYENRQKKFIRDGVRNIEEYRQKNGMHSMPRILVIIDEFQMMTQAVQEYIGNKDYRTILENLLRLTRAMGISFILCSQTIASGLSGLTDSARDQIGCRLCLKHDDDNEIRETLVLPNDEILGIVNQARNLKRGQGIYKKILDVPVEGKTYKLQKVNIIYIDEKSKNEIVKNSEMILDDGYIPKHQIIVRGNGRIAIKEKGQHPIQKFMENPKINCLSTVDFYLAAPTTLADYYKVELDNNMGSNILLVGEADNLRESIVMHSICGLLMNPDIKVVFSVIDEKFIDRQRMIEQLKKIESERLFINIGIEKIKNVISSINEFQNHNEKIVYFWYGLEKIKNEMFLSEKQSNSVEKVVDNNVSKEMLVDDLLSFLSEVTGNHNVLEEQTITKNEVSSFTYDEVCKSLKESFEMGPENDRYHFVIFNNNKSIRNIKKNGMINLEFFEHRVGTRMSLDDAYDLFGQSMVINKTDENTVIYYSGSGNVVPLRPYIIPDDKWYEKFNKTLRIISEKEDVSL